MPSPSHAVIIYNPHSTGNAKQHAEELKSELAQRLPKLEVELMPTRYAGHAIELAYEFATKYVTPLIISASGDGGYHEVINGAIRARNEDANPICAVLPSGNANDHARTMHKEPLADLIVGGRTTHLDLLKLEVEYENGTQLARYAHSYIGLGLTPSIAAELNKTTLNSLKATGIVLKNFLGFRPVQILRRGKIVDLDSIIFSTIPEMAKLIKLSTEAKPDDGAYEVISFRHKKKADLFGRFVKGVYDNLGAQSREDPYSFTMLVKAPVQLDGEVVMLPRGSRVTVSIAPGLLRTMV
jgi:diacylglycerol kinase family enzyme